MKNKSFNCLDQKIKIEGHHVLEASAGTGKTFAIEHLFSRLILRGIKIDEILIVTFTKAATSDLKKRVRKNLEKLIDELISDNLICDYLLPFVEKKFDAITLLQEALFCFDDAQIFTIHGFCLKMLSEFFFEAKFFLPNVDFESVSHVERFKQSMKDFLQYRLRSSDYLPYQIKKIFSSNTWDTLSQKVLQFLPKINERRDEKTWKEIKADFDRNLTFFQEQTIRKEKLRADFEQISKIYKKTYFKDDDFEKQIDLLCKIIDSSSSETADELFKELVETKLSICLFLADENKKKNVADKVFDLFYPNFFSKVNKYLYPSILEINSLKNVFNRLAKSIWNFVEEKTQVFLPDHLIIKMRDAIKNKVFCSAVRKRYESVLIDEFQDTDPIQWEIFSSIFLQENKIPVFYLVGDPKQSIYSFRNADIYTYFKAAEEMGEKSLFYLDTNYRSSATLVSALNVFFKRNWFYLPKTKKHLPYHPVQAARLDEKIPKDNQVAIHFSFIKEDTQSSLEEDFLFPFIVQEIERLYEDEKSYKNFAILVKDRFQEKRLQAYLEKNNIPSNARKKPLYKTLAASSLQEMLDACSCPDDLSKIKKALAGPFIGLSSSEIQKEIDSKFIKPFYQLHHVLTSKGYEFFFSVLFETCFFDQSILEHLASRELEFYQDLMQLIEIFLKQTHNNPLVALSHKTFFDDLKINSAEERQLMTRQDSLQILTLHKSKGLEFKIVFAIALGFRTKKEALEQEVLLEKDAEKLRQVYVAMTRAKRQVYVPFISFKKPSQIGSYSPIELFVSSALEQEKNAEKKHALLFLESLKKENKWIDVKILEPQKYRAKKRKENKVYDFKKPLEPIDVKKPGSVLSFSSIAKVEYDPISKVEGMLPASAEVGTIIHELLEKAIVLKKMQVDLTFIQKHLESTQLKGFEREVLDILNRTFKTPLKPHSFCLKDVKIDQISCEMEFLYPLKENHFKGFIDAIFFHDEKYYIIDWKTNWLGPRKKDYEHEKLSEAMEKHDYFLQAEIYVEVLRRYLKLKNEEYQKHFGGVFYLFLRGIDQQQRGIYFFKPRGLL